MNIVCVTDGSPRSTYLWDNKATISAVTYDAITEICLVCNTNGFLTAYDVHDMLHEGHERVSATQERIIHRWFHSAGSITGMKIFPWDADVVGACGVLVYSDYMVAGYGLLGRPLGYLSQACSTQKQTTKVAPFAAEEDLVAARKEVIEYLARGRGRAEDPAVAPVVPKPVVSATLSLPGIPPRRTSTLATAVPSLFVTECENLRSFSPMAAASGHVSPTGQRHVPVLPRYRPVMRGYSTVRRTLAPPQQLTLTPRPPAENIPSMDLSHTSFPSDIYPTVAVRTHYRQPGPPKPTALSAKAQQYFRAIGVPVHYQPGVQANAIRRNLRQRGVVVFDADVSYEEPSPRQLFPLKPGGT